MSPTRSQSESTPFRLGPEIKALPSFLKDQAWPPLSPSLSPTGRWSPEAPACPPRPSAPLSSQI